MVVEQQQAPAGTYVEAILDTFAAHPDREAVVVGAQRITYAQARSSVLRMAEVMRERGVGTGDIVAVVTGNRAEGVLLPLAVHLLGGRLALVPPEPALVEQRGFLTRAGVGAIIFDPATDRAAELARLVGPRVVLTLGSADQGEDLLALIEKQPGTMTERAGPENISSLFYTSGTTGRPKMVLHRYGYYAALVMASARRKAECPTPQRFLICTLVNHTSGHIAALITLLAQGTAVLLDGFDPARAIETMHGEKITSVGLVPPMLNEVLDHPSFPEGGFPDLIRLHYGGGPTTSARIRQALDRFGPVLRQTYGLTEIPVVTIMEPHEHDASVPGRLMAAGKPLPGLGERGEISLRDSDGEVGPGGIGEVCVRGPLVMTEYWQDPEITAQVIKDGWFHTGDLGRWDEDGYLHLVDRLKDMIITGQSSDNVYSGLLEEVLTRHPGIKMAAVVGLPDDAYGETVHAICVADPQIPVDTAELRRTAVSELGSLYEPRTITFVDSLPWTLAGKIDKKALRLMLQGDLVRPGQPAGPAPRKPDW